MSQVLKPRIDQMWLEEPGVQEARQDKGLKDSYFCLYIMTKEHE